MEMSSYVNEPPQPRPIRQPQLFERRYVNILFLSFGLLCLTQATLNITLRLTASANCESNTTVIETQGSPPCEAVLNKTKLQCTKLQDRVTALNKDKRRLTNDIYALTVQINELNQKQMPSPQNQNFNQQINEFNNKINQLNDQINSLNNQINNLMNQNQQLNKQKQEFNKQINELHNQIDRLNNQNQELTAQIEVMTKERVCGNAEQQKPRNGRSVCPNSWRDIRGRCYFLSSETRSWNSSRAYCQDHGADLVVINDEQEQRDLYAMDGNPYLLFWIGLHDGTSNGTFKWVDNTPPTRAFWQVGQPGDGGPNNQENCVEMYRQNPVLSSWNDAPCRHSRQWICEKAKHQ